MDKFGDNYIACCSFKEYFWSFTIHVIFTAFLELSVGNFLFNGEGKNI